jgi:alpha-tubulin suppressor-like RCC1 family protein
MPISYPGVQYSGIWTLQQTHDAIAAGTWPTQPVARLYGWGANGNGRLGLGNTTNYSSPKQVGTLNNWLSLSAGFYSTTSIKTDGTLWTWGGNYGGQLGLNSGSSYSSPKQVGALTNWSKTCGNNAYVHSNASITTSGALYMWGLNNYGQLGLGNITNYSSPKQIGVSTDWLEVASGTYTTLAIKTNGTLWSWGSNFNGVLGQSLSNINYTNVVNSPVQIGALTTWSKVAILNIAAAAIKTDGTLWTWGWNNFGQLGLGDTTVRTSPVQVGSLTNWLSVTAGQYNFCLAIKTDGTLWAWGANNDGQLGTGNITNRSSPVQVGSLTIWSKVVTGYSHTSAFKTDGTLWMWGANNNGQLGFSNTTSYSSPKQVGSLTTWSNIANGFYTTLGIATI